ncbi:hypothetical protein SADUNF_Sadunf05G0141900 [Salix dunnii]|uniref:SET domain-containing protein n=1 Tax=Salix dunnii TaxID=1413687 RepID=A0A835MZH6_9ROSI|nr:hypothetical protein SADUNF_Sadunf05G0141900 [Salix dunnii]
MEMRAGEEDIEIAEDMTPSVVPLSYALHDAFLHSHCSSCFSLLPARVRDGAKAIAAARRIEMDENGKNDSTLLEAVLCLVLTNAVEVQDNEGRSLGIAVYGPNFSWINHSCSPNACYRFIISPPDNVLPFRDDSRLRILPAGTKSDNGVHNNIEFPKGCSGSGPRVIVRSIKRIKKGEEVTVAYTDLLQPQEIRRSELWAKYRFICCCTRCIASPPSYVDHILQYCVHCCCDDFPIHDQIVSETGDEATRKMTDYVEEVTAEYLAIGDPESCCKKLENMLITGLLDELLEVREGKSQLNFRLHPLHHLALNSYTVLASAYKIRASNLLALHSEVGGLSWEALNMYRISAAYSLFLAASTYRLFCFESSLLASVANFWASAGESLLALAKSSAWDSLGNCGFPVLNLSPLAEHKCSKCSLLESFEVNLSFGQDQIRKADFDSVSNRFLDCFGSLLQKVWGFLIQGCRYLEVFKDPTDFTLDIWDFDVRFTHNDVDFNCWANKSASEIEDLGYVDQWRMNIFKLGVHCLLYGGNYLLQDL